MLKRILKLKMLVQSVVVFPLIFGAFQAQAMTCGPWDDYSQTVTVPIIGSGMITAGEDLPIGSILYTQRYTPVAGMTGWLCRYERTDLPFTVSPYLKDEAISMPMGAPEFFLHAKTVFPTNVPGIGVGVYMSGHGLILPYQKAGTDWEITTSTGKGSGTGIPDIQFILFKTGPIASSAQVLGSSFPTIQYSQGITQPAAHAFESPYLTVNFSGAINVVSRSCEVTDIDVDMGKYPISDFKRAGTTTEWKDFQITLRNCPPFYGYYPMSGTLAYSETNGITSNGAPTANYMKLKFTPTNGYTEPNVINLDSGSDSATGLGIQIADENETILPMNIYDSYTPNFQLTNVDGATYVLPLKARYYQYSSTVTGGKANASVMYTISYY